MENAKLQWLSKDTSGIMARTVRRRESYINVDHDVHRVYRVSRRHRVNVGLTLVVLLKIT